MALTPYPTLKTTISKIEKIYIEESLQAFRPGLSSAQVILTLGRFNGIVSWICYKVFGFEPQYIGATTARKALGIKVCLTGEGADELFGGKNYNILIRLFVLPQSSKQVGNVRRTS